MRTGNGRDPGAPLGPRGQEEGLRARGQPRPPRRPRSRASTENLEKGDGALPILLHDEQFGKAFTGTSGASRRASTRSAASSTTAQGTAGKLINDPSVFDAAHRLVVGVDQSAILRWLIKDRQKAGIKKEYHDDAHGDSPAVAPAPTPTPAATR